MKRGRAFFALLLLIAALLSPAALADGAETARKPVYAAALEDGRYKITVSSGASLFRVTGAALTVQEGQMKVRMTLSGKEYEKLFMGTGAEALAAPDDACIYYKENLRGEYTYTVPVEALDQETACAAWSIQEEKWYDWVLVFESDALPEEAYAKPAMIELVSASDAMVIVAVLAIIFLLRHKPGKKR